jgi:hypothetical protein
MARPKKQTNDKPVWAICVYHPNNICGWLIGEDKDVKTYPSQEDAEKALKQMKRNTRYSWSSPTEVKIFTGFSNRKESIND